MDVLSFFGKNPDKIIETMLSKIFFFGNKVYKVYKWDKAFYGDLSDADFRKQFISEDFFWNNVMSPDIYTKLLALKNNNGKWEETSFDDADELVIIMNKLENQATLIDFAEKEKEPDFNVLEEFIKKAITNQRKIADFRKEELAVFFAQNLKEIEKGAIEDLRSWAYMAEDIPKEKTDAVVEKLLSIIELPKYQEWCRIAKKSACMDGNGDNIIIGSGGNVSFIDILPPKVNWRVEDEVINISRAAADLSVFSEKKDCADFLYESYKKITGIQVPQIIRDLYEIRGAMIQAAYRSILNQKEREKKYLNFVEERI